MQKVYLIARFATDANQRNVQLMDLENEQRKVFFVCQIKGSRFSHPNLVGVRCRFRLASLFARLGVGKSALVRIDSVLYRPSTQVIFIKPAISTLSKLIAEDLKSSVRVVIVNLTPPHELVMIGLALKKKFPVIRWIIDWQDLWSADDYYFAGDERSRKWILQTEKEAVELCDLNIVTNDRAQGELERRYSFASGKVRAIPHAFADAERSDGAPADRLVMPKNRPLRLAFLGNLLKPPKVPGAMLLDAFQTAHEQGHQFELHVIGDKVLKIRGEEFTSKYPWLVSHPRKTHTEAARYLREFDVLVLLLGDLAVSRMILHAKLPSYLAAGRPILAIVPEDSACADVLAACGTAYLVGSGSNWKNEIPLFFARVKEGGIPLHRKDDAIESFSWPRVRHLWSEALELP